MKLDKKESDRISALALMVVARKIIASDNRPLADMGKLSDASRAEISNMLVEHLTSEQIADIAAGHVCAQVGRAVKTILQITGGFHKKAFIESVEHFCSDRIGRKVKVVED